MKKKNFAFNFLLLFLFCFNQQEVSAQRINVYDPYLGNGHLVIKGKIENKPQDMHYWKLAITNYMQPEEFQINLSENGYFEQAVPITDVQDIYLHLLDNTTKFFSYPGDTVSIFIDAQIPQKSLVLKGKNQNRQKEIDLSLLVNQQYRRAYPDIYNTIYERDISDQDLLFKINEYYTSVINIIDSFENQNGSIELISRFRDDAYFSSALVIAERPHHIGKMHLLPKISCKYPKGEAVDFDQEGNKITIPILPYNEINYTLFRVNENYRNYLSSYIHNSQVDFLYFDIPPEYMPEFAPVKDGYYFALSALKVSPIRDWYITNLLNSAFTIYDFDECSFVYQDFKKICNDPGYLKILENRYQAARNMQIGKPAPDFELLDENGATVHLSDLKGKIVYMDFWGQGCRACIPELTEHKDKLKEKYKDYDITYVYVYVTGTIEYWKRSIKQYNLKGINLIAEGWEENPVCKAYNIRGIPHYVLISKEGIIVDGNCQRPSQILTDGEHSLFDKFVKEKK